MTTARSEGRRAAHRRALVERERELDQIDDLLGLTAQGRGGALAIVGPAGIGKTSLIQAARELARSYGLTVLAARGTALTRDISYGLIRELCLPAVADGGGSATTGGVLTGAAQLAASPLGLGSLRSSGDPDPASAETQYAALFGLYSLLAHLAAESPLALLIDDLHLADDDSRTFLTYLLPRLDGVPIALLLASRGQLALADAAVIPVAPLGRDGVGALIAGRLGDSDPAFTAAVHERTGGVPFLVVALLAVLGRTNIRPDVAAVETLQRITAGAAPDLVTRIAGVLPGALEVAQVAGVLGSGADQRRISILSGQPLAAVSRIADALIDAGFLAPRWPLEFVHPLIAEAVVDSLLPGRRSELHGLAADLLGQEPGNRDQAAAHLLSAEPTGSMERFRLLREEAREAFARGAPATAATYLRRAVREGPPTEEIPATLVELGTAEGIADDPAASDHLNEALHLAEDPEQRLTAFNELSRVLLAQGRSWEILEIGRRALREWGQHDRELLLTLNAEMLAVSQMDALSPAEFGQLLASAPTEGLTGATLGEQRMLAALAFDAMRRAAPVSQCVELLDLAIPTAVRPDIDLASSAALYMSRLSLAYCEQFDRSRRLAELAIQWAATSGASGWLAHNNILLMVTALREGQLGEVEELARGAITAAGDGSASKFVGPIATSYLHETLLTRGRSAEARALLEQTGILAAPREELRIAAPLFARGHQAFVDGEFAVAADELLACGERLVGTGSVNPTTMPWRSLAALALAQCDAPERARGLVEEEVVLARQFGADGVLGRALTAAGNVIGGEEGIDYLRSAVAVLEHSPARLERARGLVSLGAALRRAGNRRESRELLRTGLEDAQACDADALIARAEDELRSSGARLIKRPVSGIDALTPSETRTARLAAVGLSNAEIAQRLFLSTKTIEAHLGRTYRKLGITQRSELSSMLKMTA